MLLPQRYMRVGHFNSFLARGGDLNKNFPKIQMHEGCLERGGGGMLKIQFDWYIKQISQK